MNDNSTVEDLQVRLKRIKEYAKLLETQLESMKISFEILANTIGYIKEQDGKES